MWRILRFIFLGYWNHKHKWKIIKSHQSTVRMYSGSNLESVIYVLQCSECGDIKQQEIK